MENDKKSSSDVSHCDFYSNDGDFSSSFEDESESESIGLKSSNLNFSAPTIDVTKEVIAKAGSSHISKDSQQEHIKVGKQTLPSTVSIGTNMPHSEEKYGNNKKKDSSMDVMRDKNRYEKPYEHKNTLKVKKLTISSKLKKNDNENTKLPSSVCFHATSKTEVRNQKIKQMREKSGVNPKDERKKKPYCYSQTRLEQLSKPRKHSSIVSSTNLDLYGRKDTVGKSQQQKNIQIQFLNRMEAAKKRKQTNLQRAISETHYANKLDKKVCRSCGNFQSYEEVINNSNSCPNNLCKGQEYSIPTKFNICNFQMRMERSSERKMEVINKIEEERCITKKHFLKSRRQRELLQRVSEKGKSFLNRMADDISSRKQKIIKLEQEKQKQIEKSCPFQPKVNVPTFILKSRHNDGGIDRLYKAQKKKKKEKPQNVQKPKRKKRSISSVHSGVSRSTHRDTTNTNITKNPSSTKHERVAQNLKKLLL